MDTEPDIAPRPEQTVLVAELKDIQRRMDAYIDSYIKRINDHT